MTDAKEIENEDLQKTNGGAGGFGMSQAKLNFAREIMDKTQTMARGIIKNSEILKLSSLILQGNLHSAIGYAIDMIKNYGVSSPEAKCYKALIEYYKSVLSEYNRL